MQLRAICRILDDRSHTVIMGVLIAALITVFAISGIELIVAN